MVVHCIDRDIKALAALGKTGFLKIMAITPTVITTDDFLKFVADWITTTHHPRFNRLYTELVYIASPTLAGSTRRGTKRCSAAGR